MRLAHQFEFLREEKGLYAWIILLILASIFSVTKVTTDSGVVLIVAVFLVLAAAAGFEIRGRKERFKETKRVQSYNTTVECPRCMKKSLILEYSNDNRKEIEIRDVSFFGERPRWDKQYVIEVRG